MVGKPIRHLTKTTQWLWRFKQLELDLTDKYNFMVQVSGVVFLCISTLRLSDLDCMVHLTLSVHCHCRRNQRGTKSSQLRTSCQLTDRWCLVDMEMVQMSPPHSRNLDTAVWHSSQIQHRKHIVIWAHYYTDVLSLLPRGQLSHVDCLDKDWKVPERQTVGLALPAGHAWPGGHSEPVPH